MANLAGVPSGNNIPAVRSNSERRLGILHYTGSVDSAWRGDIRKRYTDFIVHEVRRDGSVVYLTDIAAAPEKKESVRAIENANAAPSQSKPSSHVVPEVAKPVELPSTDVQALEAIVGTEVAATLQETYAAMLTGTLTSRDPITLTTLSDRAQRSNVHHEMRRIFSGRFETEADPKTGAITAVPTSGGGKQRGGTGRDAAPGTLREGRGRGGAGRAAQNQGGKYLHFTLYKENKDTMEAINHLARMLKIKSSNFGFAGTKDRRAATTQRVSVWRHGSQDIGWLNSKSSIKIGDFSHHKAPIQLGQHGGNDFVIVVKNVELVRGADCSLAHRLRMTEACVQSALDNIMARGFINYFGLQRFGTHAIGTQEVGQKILSEDFEGAADAILHVEPDLVARLDEPDLENSYHRDEILRTRAITMWRETSDLDAALQIIPRRFSAESTILRHLGSNSSSRRDFCGALLKITRGLRNLYIHAYQSYVWNWAVSLRWSKYGDQVVAGDLILVESEANPTRFRQGQDMSEDLNQEEEQFYQEARALAADEAASGKYSIYDVVLPVPGYDILYPENDIGKFYVEFMGRPENGGMNPYEMRRGQKEFSLSGHYRKILARFSTTPKFYVRPYSDDAEQMHPTDLDDIRVQQDLENQKREQMRTASLLAAAMSSAEESASTIANTDDKTRRRQCSPNESPQNNSPPEKRVNDGWIENNSGGGSKRVKVDAVANRLPGQDDGVFDRPISIASEPTSSSISHGTEGTQSTQATQTTSGTDDKRAKLTTLSTLSLQAQRSNASGNASGSGSSSPLPPAIQIQNVFRVTPGGMNGAAAGDKAINLSSAARQDEAALVEDMKIAVALNFRLSSSNYATICLREMMSSSSHWEAPSPSGGQQQQEKADEHVSGGHSFRPAANTTPTTAQV